MNVFIVYNVKKIKMVSYSEWEFLTIQALKPLGFGLNEAAVQLITSKVIGITKEYVKYFGISFDSVSPSYYPLECHLTNLLSYLVGENVLFKSTLNASSLFENTLKSVISKKNYIIISNSIDYILNLEEEISKLNNKLIHIDNINKKADNIIVKITELKEEIKVNFLRTQNLIISSYFDLQINNIKNLEELENYRKKLSGIKNHLGFAEGYTFFDDYYCFKMGQLEHIYNILENGGSETAIDIMPKYKNSFFFNIIKNIKILININISSKDKKKA